MADAPAATVHQPFDIDVEQALLGSLIRNSALAPQAVAILDPDHFYDPLHARIYSQIIEWATSGEMTISVLTLSAAMKSDPGVTETGTAYFTALAGAAPAIPNVRDYANIIRDLSIRRDALWALEDAREAISATAVPIRGALSSILSVAESAERAAATLSFKSAFDSGMESLRAAQRASSGGRVRAVKTGSDKLDGEIGGIQGGDFVVIPGKSGMGKSALMGGICWRAAAAFYPVIVFSLEMKRPQWVQRLVTDIDFDTADAPMEYRKYRNGGFSDGEFARALLATQALQAWPWLEIHDEDGLTMAQIAARSRAFQAQWRDDPAIREGQGCQPGEDPIGLVIIDYIQIVDPASRQFRPREQEVAGIARGCKALAKNLDWGVIAGSQMNEDDKGRAKDNQRPHPGDVRESKAIFHEADIMAAPYRPGYYVWQRKPDAQPGEPAHIAWQAEFKAARNTFELLGLKNRMGRPFNLDLFCEIGANVVRDHAPMGRKAQQEADDLLASLGGR